MGNANRLQHSRSASSIGAAGSGTNNSGRYPEAYPSQFRDDAGLKFFRPIPKTPTAKNRKKLLAQDGLPLTGKMSSELGYGRNELRSKGVEDNFGNSYYYSVAQSKPGKIANMFGH